MANDDTIKIAIEAVDNASKIISAAGDSVDKLGKRAEDSSKGLINVNDALAKMIQQERVSKVLEEARGAMEHLTDAEKDQIVKAHELEEAQKDAGAGAEEGAKGFESFAGKLVAIQAGVSIAQEAIGGLKQVWDFAKQGAENQQIAASFQRTAKSIGSNADDIIAKLNSAAKGTIDDEELMQASTRALTLGVAQSGDDLVKVMQLSRAAALQFGGDTGQAFESINQAIGNLAPRALKQYGIIVSLSEANKKYADSIGVSVDSLTEEQQRQALLNEVLIQGAKNFGDIGNAAATAGEKMKAAETKVQDLTDQIKEGALNAVIPYVNSLDFLTKEFDKNASQLEVLQSAYDLSVSQFGEDSRMAIILKDQIDKLTQAQQANAKGTTDAADEGVRNSNRMRQAQHDLQVELLAVEQGARNQAATYATLDSAMDSATAKANVLAASQKIITSEMADLKSAMAGALQNEFTSFGNKQDDLATKAAKVKEELDKLEASQGRAVTSTKKHGLTANEAALAQLELAKAQKELSAETAKGNLTIEQQAALQDKVALNQGKLEGVTKTQIKGSKELTAAQEALKSAQADLNNNTDPEKQLKLAIQVDNLKEKLGQAAGAVTQYVDNSKRISELQGQYDEINKEIAANVAEHEKATKTILFGYAEQQLAVDGLTGTEADALDALAVKWKLKSQEDVDALKNIRTAAVDLARDGSITDFTNTVSANLDKVNADYEKTQGVITETAQSVASAAASVPAIDKEIKIKVTPEIDYKNLREGKQEKPLTVTVTPKIAPLDPKLAHDLAEKAKFSPTVTPKIDTTQASKDLAGYVTNQLGLIPQQKKTQAILDTASALRSRDDLIKAMNLIPVKKTTTMYIEGKDALQVLYDIQQNEDKIYSKTIEILVKYKTQGEPPPGYAHGGSYIVPPSPTGSSADYFPVLAAQGERVTIETKAQQRQQQPIAGTGDTYNYTTNVYNPLAAAMLADKQRRDRLARSNSRMGVT